MIEKHIHYCWFGRGEKPQIVKECMATWKEKCPEYTITEWNEDNFDVNYCQYTREAYAAKKYAFVSDVARLWIIYHYGGTYLDTDVKLRDSLDELSKLKTWFAAERIAWVNTGLGFGSEKHNALIYDMLTDYHDRKFTLEACSDLNTRIVRKKYPSLIFEFTQTVDDITFIGFKDYPNYAEHLATMSWNPESAEFSKKRRSNKKWYQKYRWRIHVKLQQSKLMRWCLKHENSPLSKVYMFFVFDIWPNGFLNSVLPIIQRKIKN